MAIPYYHIDVFTDELFAGNPAGVCILPAFLAESMMQKIAAENDCRAHLSSAFSKFFNDGKEHGFKEALRRRDEPYGDLTGDHRADSIVKLNILKNG